MSTLTGADQKEEGHFFHMCAMLCIEAGESIPEMID